MRPGPIHLHCGDAAAAVHRRSGLPGQVRVWRDSPAVGPWTSAPAELLGTRATWWGVPEAELRDRANLVDLQRSSEAVLWFGPDPWEQAALLWVLGELPEGVLPELVSPDQGVGRLAPASLPKWLAARAPLEEATLRTAKGLWRRFLEEGWGALAGAGAPGLPWLEPALARLAEDHPPTGLGRTRRQVLAALAQGHRDLPALLEALEGMEDPRHGAWYGDLCVARMVEATGFRLG